MLPRSSARGLALGLWVTSLAAAHAAPAAKGQVAVIELDTPGAMMGLGSQVVQEVVSAAKAQGYSVLAPEQVQERLGQQGAERLRKCAGQKSCVLANIGPLGVDKVVFGQLGRDEKSYLLKLYFVDAKTGSDIADVDRAILIASRRFKQDVQEAVPRMMRGESEARGTLRITSNVKNAAVWIDGEPAGKTPFEVKLKPGKYQVQLEKKAYLPIKRFVDVYANKVSDEDFRLILEPNGVPEEDGVPALVGKPEQPQEPAQHGPRVTLPAWIAFGAAAVTGGVGAYYGLKAQSTERALKDGFDAATQTYQGTRQQALDGKAQAKTANLLYGGAALAAAAGVLFVVFDVGGDDADVTAAPSVGCGGAGVTLQGRF